MIYGRKPALETIKNRPDEINKIFIQKTSGGSEIKEIISLARHRNIPFQFIDARRLDKLSGDRNHQGVVIDVLSKKYASIEEIIERGKDPSGSRVICLLDGITDVVNLGTLLRNSGYFGIMGLVTEKRNSATLSDVVMKISAGAAEVVPVARVSNIGFLIDRLKKEGYWLAGADSKQGTDLNEVTLPRPLAIIFGSEGTGLSRLVKEKCDFLIKIEGSGTGKIESLNVASASAIIFFELLQGQED